MNTLQTDRDLPASPTLQDELMGPAWTRLWLRLAQEPGGGLGVRLEQALNSLDAQTEGLPNDLAHLLSLAETGTERMLLCGLFADGRDPAVHLALRTRSDTSDLTVGRAVLWLAGGDPALERRLLDRLAPQAPLVREGWLLVDDPRHDGLLNGGLRADALVLLVDEHWGAGRGYTVLRPKADLRSMVLEAGDRARLEAWLAQCAESNGLRLLIAGQPGTGKTLLAHCLASHLNRPLICVDGPPEGEGMGTVLHRVSREARKLRAVVFFDEAARFMAGETKRLSHGTGQLLTWLDDQDFPVIAATNELPDLMAPFVRRFHVKLDFGDPGPALRQSLWTTLLPGLADELAVTLARKFSLPGGYIRNIATLAGESRDEALLLRLTREQLLQKCGWTLLSPGLVPASDRLSGKLGYWSQRLRSSASLLPKGEGLRLEFRLGLVSDPWNLEELRPRLAAATGMDFALAPEIPDRATEDERKKHILQAFEAIPELLQAGLTPWLQHDFVEHGSLLTRLVSHLKGCERLVMECPFWLEKGWDLLTHAWRLNESDDDAHDEAQTWPRYLEWAAGHLEQASGRPWTLPEPEALTELSARLPWSDGQRDWIRAALIEALARGESVRHLQLNDFVRAYVRERMARRLDAANEVALFHP